MRSQGCCPPGVQGLAKADTRRARVDGDTHGACSSLSISRDHEVVQAAKKFPNPEHIPVKALWQVSGQNLCEAEGPQRTFCTHHCGGKEGGGLPFLLGKLEVTVTLTKAGFIVWQKWEWAQGEPWKNGVLTGGLGKLGRRTGTAVTSRSGHMPYSTTPHHLTALSLGSFICKTLLRVAPSPWFYLSLPGATAIPLWQEPVPCGILGQLLCQGTSESCSKHLGTAANSRDLQS